MLLAYPVPGRDNRTEVGRRAYNIVWYRPADPDNDLVDLCTDATGRRHGTTIAPPLIRRDVTAAIKATARALVAPQIAEIFERCGQPFFQPIFDLESPQIVFGRVALLGDAAFVARPHAGAGTTKAALDAACLADCIAAHGLHAGLARYQREQGAFGRALVALSRDEGVYLTAQIKPRAERSQAELRRDVEEVILAHNSRSENLRKLLSGLNAGR
jgi:2-polyprenyl-6-methoxyphenol hydroxylase-like FAD-dependent oxidoreductase